MSEKKQAVAVERPIIEVSLGTLSRIQRFAEKKRNYDGTERSIDFWLEEALDKGVDTLDNQLKSAIELRNARDFKKAQAALGPCPMPKDLAHPTEAEVAAMTEWQRNDNIIRRKCAVGGTQVAL